MIPLITRPDSVPVARPNKIRTISYIKIMSTIGSIKHQSSRTTRLYPSGEGKNRRCLVLLGHGCGY